MLEEFHRRNLKVASNGGDISPFPDWLKQVSPQWVWDWEWQQYVQEHLRALTEGEIRRLAVFLPPQHGKSHMVTVRYPVWRLEREPSLRVVIGCYNQLHATRFSRWARRLAAGRIGIYDDRRAAHEWETLGGGGMIAVGVGAGITGNPCDLLIIDDPVKSREEAESEVYRERVWDWYTDDLYTRLQQNASIVLIQTRWHEDDLAGRILSSPDARNWTVISLPAEAEDDDPLGRLPGEPLCPERFDYDALQDRKRVLGSYSFSALYQQRPAPLEGARFRQSWFRYFTQGGEFYSLKRPGGVVHNVPVGDCWRFQTIDPAATEKDTSDWFVCSTWDVTPERDLLLLDVFRERAETTKHEEICLTLFDRLKPDFVGVEKTTYGLNIIQRLLMLGLPVIELKADRDKLSRSLTIQTRYEAGTVYHLADAPWLDVAESELLGFPTAKHDDFVDTASYAGVVLLSYAPWEEPVEPEPVTDDRTDAGLRRLIASLTPVETDDYF